jgi:hypothetical protein
MILSMSTSNKSINNMTSNTYYDKQNIIIDTYDHLNNHLVESQKGNKNVMEHYVELTNAKI